MKKLVLITLMCISVSCNQIKEWNKPKPVKIDGLGSLSMIKNKDLSENEFNKLLKTTSKLNYVREEDADAMFEIFKQNILQFYEISKVQLKSNEKADYNDVKMYLQLIIIYEKLRQPVEETVWQKSKQILKEEANFANPKSNTATSVGNFISLYFSAFQETIINEKNVKELLEKKKGEILDKINFVSLQIFEEKAKEIIENSEAGKEQQTKAAKFLEDIKIYNQAMPADEKILDANGKLVDPFAPTTNGGQRNNLVNLAQGDVITKYKKTPGTEEASRRIGDIVRPTAETIELKVKGSYQP